MALSASYGKVRLFPNLSLPDWEWWERYYPAGIGSSIFSSPGWQKIMAMEMESPWQLYFYRTVSGDKTFTIPVYVRRGNWGRVEITVRPIAYYVTPIEDEILDSETLKTILKAVKTPFISVFTWWLPPWSGWQEAFHAYQRWGMVLDMTFGDSYLIHLHGSVDEHMRRNVNDTQNRHLRMSYRNGIEVIENPSPDLIDQYYDLHMRVWTDDKWVGPHFTSSFFHAVATTLGDGGRMIIMRYQGCVVGGGVLLCDRKAVHYYQGTIDREVKQVCPHAVLYKTALDLAEKRGVPFVNLGGVNPGNSGLIRYKESWGAVRSTVPMIQWRYEVPALARKVLVCVGSLFRK